MDDATPKKGKPLTDAEQFNNLCKALAEDSLTDNTPPKDEPWAEKAKKKKETPKTRGGV